MTRALAADAPGAGAEERSDAAPLLPFDLLPGERVLWVGQPLEASFLRHVLRLFWVAAYFAVLVVFRLYQGRSHGLSIVASVEGALPLALLGTLFVLACHGCARAWVKASRYVVTSERCVLQIGIALTATLSLPWQCVSRVALAMHGDGSGDIALSPRRPHRLRFVNLWPHARAWHFLEPEPMLRCVADARQLSTLIIDAMRAAQGRSPR